MKLLIVLALMLFSSVGYAESTDAVKLIGDIKVDGIYFSSNGSVQTKAATDGKSILHGSGAPTVTANAGDFYLDTANNRLYGPYTGSWGAGVSLVGPQGIQGLKGNTGASGAAGPQGPSGPPGGATFSGPGVCGVYPSTKSNYVFNGWNPAGSMSGSTPVNATSLSQLINFYAYPSGNVLGLENNYGFQLTAGGVLVTNYLQYLSNGFIDSTFPKFPIAGSRWKYIMINGSQQAMVLDTSPVRYAIPRDIFFAVNGQYVEGGNVFIGPTAAMAQTTQFSTSMVSGKSTTIASKSSYVSVTFGSNGSITGTTLSSSPITSGMTWTISSGKLNIVYNSTIIYEYTIVGGNQNCYAVTYKDLSSTQPSTVIGPIAMTLI